MVKARSSQWPVRPLCPVLSAPLLTPFLLFVPPAPGTGRLLPQGLCAPACFPHPFSKSPGKALPSTCLSFSLSFRFSLLSAITQHDIKDTPLFCLWSIFPLKSMLPGRQFTSGCYPCLRSPYSKAGLCGRSASLTWMS